MNGISKISYPSDAVGSTVILGCFDGVHIGHRALFCAASELSSRLGTKIIVVSFEEPPAFSLSADGGKLLTDTVERSKIFSALGADDVVYLRFSEVRDMSAEDFISSVLVERLGARAVVCGYNFTFGKNKSGNADTLRSAFGNNISVCEPVMFEGEPVSSSRIRNEICLGNVDKAEKMLGRPYSLSGITFHGRGDGTKLGFATANIFPNEKKALPAPGVYAVRVEISDDGRTFDAVADAGYAPTLDSTGKYRIEAHLFDFSESLYDKHLKISFFEKIRSEKKFSSSGELAAQIALDTERAKAFFATH